ncbi:MAG: hypothetical protein IJ167_02515, partial [Lachnospiraceae bacterium]|nr:hypothetical protein [Lachnospiraceae bacterium]
EYWSELCLQRKQECGKRALDYCAVGFLGTAALIWGIRRVLEVYLGENMFSYPNPSTECGILLLSGVLFLFVGCKMSMGYALVALKTTARKKAVLAIILNFLFLIASVAVLIITIAEV